jgi:hypothetical protein
LVTDDVISNCSQKKYCFGSFIHRIYILLPNHRAHKLEEPKRKVTLQDTVSSKVPPKKNVEKHIKIMSRTSSTQIYQAIPKDSGASLKVNVVNQQAYPPERLRE